MALDEIRVVARRGMRAGVYRARSPVPPRRACGGVAQWGPL